MKFELVPAVLLIASGLLACQNRERPILYPQQPYAQQGGAAAQPPPGQPPTAAGATGPVPAPGPAPPQPQPAAQTPPSADPIQLVDISFLQGRAQSVLRELVGALNSQQRATTEKLPLVFDDEVGEVNAFAACTEQGKALIAISDGMLDIQAHLAQAKAFDERFGTNKVDEYVQLLSRSQRPGQPIVQPAPGFFPQPQAMDPGKLERQHQLLDEELAFVLGHELAHHYLGHLPCTAAGLVAASELGATLSSMVPGLNQPNELAADAAGIHNVLTAGARRPQYRWTEGGALLVMQFFSGIDRLTAESILFGFERSHPPPALRIPVIQQAVNFYHLTSGG